MNRALLFSKFIKYDDIDRLIASSQSAKILYRTPVDIYIDIQSVYKQVLSSTLLSKDVKLISINILNLAAHYRHYFYTRGVNTRVYIVDGENTSNTIVADANIKNDDLFAIVKKLIKYFPLAYYIKRSSNASAVILSMIQSDTFAKQHSAFVVSNDIYSWQIPAIVPNSFVLRPSINTKLISYNTVLSTLYSQQKSVDLSTLDPGLLPIIMAYYKCPELGMEMLNNFKKTISIIKNKIETNQILNSYNSPSILRNEPQDIFLRIYKCDLVFLTIQYNNSYESMDNTWTVHEYCDMNTLFNVIDTKINTDPDNLFNYLFLLDVSDVFCNSIGV